MRPFWPLGGTGLLQTVSTFWWSRERWPEMPVPARLDRRELEHVDMAEDSPTHGLFLTAVVEKLEPCDIADTSLHRRLFSTDAPAPPAPTAPSGATEDLMLP